MTTWAPAGQPWALVAWREDGMSYRVIRCAATRDDAQVAKFTCELDYPEGRFQILYRPCAAPRRNRLEY